MDKNITYFNMLLSELPIISKQPKQVLNNCGYKLYIYENDFNDVLDEEIIARFKFDLPEYIKSHSSIYKYFC